MRCLLIALLFVSCAKYSDSSITITGEGTQGDVYKVDTSMLRTNVVVDTGQYNGEFRINYTLVDSVYDINDSTIAIVFKYKINE